jgi:hypothetical protein
VSARIVSKGMCSTGKLKNPENATGGYLYVAVTDIDKEPLNKDEFRKRDFSSNNKHKVRPK